MREKAVTARQAHLSGLSSYQAREELDRIIAYALTQSGGRMHIIICMSQKQNDMERKRI